MSSDATDFKSIIQLDSELNQIQDLDLLLERLLLEARKVVCADAGSIYVRHTEQGEGGPVEKLLIKYAQNDTIQQTLPPGQKMIYLVSSVLVSEKSISGYCALTGKMINVPDMYNIPEETPYFFYSNFDKITGYKTISSLTFPLASAEGRLLGVIQVLNKKDKQGNVIPFSEEDEFLLTHFAANATVALQRAFVTRAMILRMIRMSELRDPKETGTHVNRVAGYAVEIYDRWAYNNKVPDAERERFRDMLKIGSMLHDVGKVAISDLILKKPSRFTPEEYRVMQHHTLYGASLFDDPHSPIDAIAKDIALTHHENWDGTGYPGWADPRTRADSCAPADSCARADSRAPADSPAPADPCAPADSRAPAPLTTSGQGEGGPAGRKGDEIPLAGRIVAIADVFDALCSKRVYKEPWSEEQVLEEMRRLSGSKFDPDLIDIFFEVLPSIKQTQGLYPEE